MPIYLGAVFQNSTLNPIQNAGQLRQALQKSRQEQKFLVVFLFRTDLRRKEQMISFKDKRTMDTTNLLIISLLLLKEEEEEDHDDDNRKRRERWAAMSAVEKDERTRSIPRISLPEPRQSPWNIAYHSKTRVTFLYFHPSQRSNRASIFFANVSSSLFCLEKSVNGLCLLHIWRTIWITCWLSL